MPNPFLSKRSSKVIKLGTTTLAHTLAYTLLNTRTIPISIKIVTTSSKASTLIRM